MIDSEQLTAGQKYKMLPTTYIIFICPFDPFDLSRHIYTFRNLCVEDKELELDDKTTKIFVNSTGTEDDVTPDVKAFLDYVNGVLSDDAFVREIDDEIVRVKQIEQERVGYMTYAMKIEEERELAEEKGREEGRKELTKKFFKLFSCIRESGNEKDFELATSDPNSLPGLYLKYGIS
jgi:predicted transposase/invertase (TIGR01784 family)